LIAEIDKQNGVVTQSRPERDARALRLILTRYGLSPFPKRAIQIAKSGRPPKHRVIG